ncbi:MAG TPA: lysophospholipase [Pirellulaceae bacterium]|nr:lysophospholipase [Pirellulaceae bacterium]
MAPNISVTHATFALPSSASLFAQSWTPVSELLGTIGIVHGLGEHSGRYTQFAEQLARAGFRVVAYDQRGHGRTSGKRGDAPSYEVLLDDIAALIAVLAAEEAGLPKYLFGQSLGGNLVLNFALRRRSNLIGIIASSPFLLPTNPPPRWKRCAARLLARTYPSFQFRTGVQAEDLSHDAAVVATYKADPLVHDLVSARVAVAMFDAGQWALDHASELTLPALLLHGTADPITSPDATIEFAQRAGHACTLRTFADLYHELHWERERAMAFNTVLDWLNR